MSRTYLIVGSILSVVIINRGVDAQRPGEEWPRIRAKQAQQTFVDPGKNNADTPFKLLISDVKGVVVYRLECHNGNYETDAEITFSGDFHCALFAVSDDQRRS